LAHVARRSLLRLLGAGELRHAVPDERFADATSTAWLEDVGRVLATDPSIIIESTVLDGEPGAAIGDYARTIGAAAIVVAAHREGVVRESVIGSSALRILRHAPCPVLVARRRNGGDYRKAVAAVDIVPAAERVIAAATGLLPQLELTLLHVYRVPDESRWRLEDAGVKELVETLRYYARASAERGLASLAVSAPQASVRLEYGFAASEILDLVMRESSDVLVISQHRGTQLHERVLGSVTQFLLSNCPCDLLLVP